MTHERYSLLAGDIDGKFSEFFAKVDALNKKHNFDVVIVAGNLFADPESEDEAVRGELSKLLRGKIKIPATTYCSLGTRPLPQAVVEKLEADHELCENLFLLGRKSTVKTADGFKIVVVGGKYMPGSDEPMNQYDPVYNDVDVQTAGKDIDQADVLLTSDWPADVSKGSKTLYRDRAPPGGTQCVADLCARLKPRYHFSTSKAFYERQPFFQPGDFPRDVTRFISIAPFGNAEKEKAMYAFTLEPSQPPPQHPPEGCTPSPFLHTKKRKLDTQQESYDKIRYANGGAPDYGGRNYGGTKKPRRGKSGPPTPDECFFCLSNRRAFQDEGHMITSIAENTYMTIAKGPLPANSTFKELGIPCHMLIIPIAHAATIKAIPGEEEREETVKEMEQYRTALQKMVAEKSRGPDEIAALGAVTYEISKSDGVHLQWQFMPMPVDLINRSIVEAGFEAEAENRNWPKFAKGDEEVRAAEEGDFFRVHIWTETFQREMILRLDGSFRFDLQYGRKVLAKLLRLDSRMDWRACAQEKAVEAADAEAFKKVF